MGVILCLCCLAVLAELVLATVVYRTSTKKYDPAPADVIILLGAKVHPDGHLSLTLSRRTEKGFEAWQKGLAPAIIACGAQGRDEPVTEASAMADYLEKLGMPRERVYLEDQSINTLENLQNAQAIMAEHGMSRAIVVTSDYHIQRALWLCEEVGLDAEGYPSKGPDTLPLRVKAYLQEAVSWVKYAIERKFVRG